MPDVLLGRRCVGRPVFVVLCYRLACVRAKREFGARLRGGNLPPRRAVAGLSCHGSPPLCVGETAVGVSGCSNGWEQWRRCALKGRNDSYAPPHPLHPLHSLRNDCNRCNG